MIYGYAHFNPQDQNLAREIKGLKKYGCGQIYREKKSAKKFERAAYKEMRSKMCCGDVLVVYDLSSLGKNRDEIKVEWKTLIDEEIDIVVLNMPILDTRKYKDLEGVGQLVSDLVLTLLSWMVEEEKERTRAAQREGIEIAKKDGRFKGGKKKYHSEATGKDKLIYDEVIRLLEEDISVMEIHRKTGLARNTIYAIKAKQNY